MFLIDKLPKDTVETTDEPLGMILSLSIRQGKWVAYHLWCDPLCRWSEAKCALHVLMIIYDLCILHFRLSHDINKIGICHFFLWMSLTCDVTVCAIWKFKMATSGGLSLHWNPMGNNIFIFFLRTAEQNLTKLGRDVSCEFLKSCPGLY